MKRLGFYILFSVLGFSICLLLQVQLKLSGVVSSALVAISSFFLNKEAKAALYSGSFSAIGLINYPFFFYFIPIVQGGFLMILDRFFIGLGGKLGSISFISFGVFYLLEAII